MESVGHSWKDPQAGPSSAADGATAPPAAQRRPARSALGISTVITDEFSRPVREGVDPETGEITRFVRDDKSSSWRLAYDADADHMQRWLLLRRAQAVLSHGPGAFELRDKKDRALYLEWPAEEIASGLAPSVLPWHPSFCGPLQEGRNFHRWFEEARIDGQRNQVQALEPVQRVVNCLTRRLTGRDAEVWSSKASDQCSWHNLTVCGSPWACIVCSRRINLGRQEQIRTIYEATKEVGGSAYMVTFTVKHGLGDECAVLVDRMKEAMQLVQKSATWKAATRREPLKRPRPGSLPFLGYIGRIAALEATHGKNGWHPHEHHLWFFDRRLTPTELSQLREALFDAWRAACVAVGLPEPLASRVNASGRVQYVGLDVREALSAAEYMAKFSELGQERRWSVEKEIASSHSKNGRQKGRTPFQLLADSLKEDDPEGGLNRDALLFRDFCFAFLGRHQLQVSRTMKKWLRERGVDLDETEKGDAELAASLEDDAEFRFSVSASDWKAIAANKAQANVLAICKAAGSDAALAYVRELRLGQEGRSSGVLDQLQRWRRPVDFAKRWAATLMAAPGFVPGFTVRVS